MSFSKSDFPLIKWSVFAFFASALFGAAMILLSTQYFSYTLKGQQEAQKQLVNARNKLNTAQSDLENMSTYAMEYQYLQDNLVIGDEHRLDWMEGLENMRQRHIVPQFTYTINAQTPYIPNPPLELGNYQLNLTGLSLHLSLLHEEQLIKFLAGLRTDIKGWPILESCSIERMSKSDDKASVPDAAARLSATCSGGWITINNRNTP